MASAPSDGSHVVLLMAGGAQFLGTWWPGDTEAPKPQWGCSLVGIGKHGNAAWASEFIDADPVAWRPVTKAWTEQYERVAAFVMSSG